jgi:hypothetical protein
MWVAGNELLAFEEKGSFIDWAFKVAKEGEFLGSGGAAFKEQFEVRAGLLAAIGSGKKEGKPGMGGEICRVVQEHELKVVDGFTELPDVDIDIGKSGSGAETIGGVIPGNAAVVAGGFIQSLLAGGSFAGDEESLTAKIRVFRDKPGFGLSLRIASGSKVVPG